MARTSGEAINAAAGCAGCGRPLLMKRAVVADEAPYCRSCARELTGKRADYNGIIRILSGVSGLVALLSLTSGVLYCAVEWPIGRILISGAIGILAISLVLMGLFPEQAGARLRLRLDKAPVYLLAVAVAVMLTFAVDTAGLVLYVLCQSGPA